MDQVNRQLQKLLDVQEELYNKQFKCFKNVSMGKLCLEMVIHGIPPKKKMKLFIANDEKHLQCNCIPFMRSLLLKFILILCNDNFEKPICKCGNALNNQLYQLKLQLNDLLEHYSIGIGR